MKYFNFIILIQLILFVISPIPNWDFQAQSINLISNSKHEYIIYTKTEFGTTVTLKKEIIISGGAITAKNYLTVGTKTNEVPFEDIYNSFKDTLGCTLLICPKGKFHPYDFYNNRNITPPDFKEKGDWDLSCFYHLTLNFLIIYSHNKNKHFYYSKTNTNNIKDRTYYFKEIYDFKIENECCVHDYEYKFPILTLNNEETKIRLSGKCLIMNKEQENINGNDKSGTKDLINAKNNNQAYFDDNNYFYFFSCNDIYDFESGYSTSKFTLPYYDASSISIKINEISPLSFVDDVEIKKMKLISGTKYLYYILESKNTRKNFYGLIDIKLNKVVYNFNEEITTFIPYIYQGNKDYMLAITSNSAYKLCIVKSGESCLDSCTMLSRDPDGNKCQNVCENNKIKLMPEEICIKKELCDLNIYILNSDETECGLCNYFYPNGNKYKLINTTGCLGYIPNNTDFYNENLNLLKCKINYHLENNECIPDYCYSLCSTCYGISNDIDDQKCLTCINGYNKNEKNNCIKIDLTTIPTTIKENTPTTHLPTTIITNLPTTQAQIIPQYEACKNKRCLLCDRGSNSYGLCLTCDETLYEKVNYTKKYSKYIDCVQKSKLQIKYYHDNITNQYKPCFEYCKTCLGPGNATVQNCLECDDNYMLRPGDNPHNNCVTYSKYYYLSPYNEYKPLNNPQCPEEAKYTVKDENNKISCIYDCKANKEYKYLYNGNCYKNCSLIEGTSNDNYICKETDINKIFINENPIYIETNDSISIIQTLAISYAEEFNYTQNHISVYKNEEITVVIYKNKTIIGDTNLPIPNIDFGECYDKVKLAYNITDNLIIAIADKKVKNNPSTFYLFFHPISGRKLETGDICKNDHIEMKENLLSMLDEKSENYELQKDLTKQGVNIFDINDPYYKDICYDFDNPKDRDMALNDRIKETYVNVSLCDEGCTNTGIDIKNNVASCNCKFNEVTDNDLIHENAALEYLVGEFFDFVNASNIMVLKCYKYIFKYFTRSIGAIIILTLFLLNIAFSLLFIFIELIQMKRYIFLLSEKYTAFLQKLPNFNNSNPPKRNEINNNTEKVLNFLGAEEENNKKNYHKKNKSSTIRSINLVSNSKQQLNSKDLIIYNKRMTNILKTKNENSLSKFDEVKKLKKYFNEYLSTLPDDMEYDDAIKKDKRSFCRYFLDNLEESQSIAYTFFASDPINTRMIKLVLFTLNIDLYFVVCGLFYSEAYISELYHIKKEHENFFSFVPRIIDKIIYSTCVAIVIGYLTDCFFLDEKKVKGIFKRDKDNRIVLKRNIALLIKEIQKRYISFIIMTFIIFGFSFYYVLCFNYVYPKTQMEWIKSSILIFIIMQILSIIKCILETIFRFLSFKFESEKLYKISKFFDS